MYKFLGDSRTEYIRTFREVNDINKVNLSNYFTHKIFTDSLT